MPPRLEPKLLELRGLLCSQIPVTGFMRSNDKLIGFRPCICFKKIA
jgi:hypothetical protein